MKQKQIAILGANSHIAQSLIHLFLLERDCHLHLFVRRRESIPGWWAAHLPTPLVTLYEGYEDFAQGTFDLILNCVGVGTLRHGQATPADWFFVTEKYDNLVLRYLVERAPRALYVSLSSGAVYGQNFSAPMQAQTRNSIAVNQIQTTDYYAIARLNAEAKHRALAQDHQLNILDLRMFSYFSRFINLQDGYLLSDIMQAILGQQVLVTNELELVRDYIHPQDLYQVIRTAMASGPINATLDLRSQAPIAKSEILKYFQQSYGLRYEVRPGAQAASPSGVKAIYYSIRETSADFKFWPRFSSLQTLIEESAHILSRVSTNHDKN